MATLTFNEAVHRTVLKTSISNAATATEARYVIGARSTRAAANMFVNKSVFVGGEQLASEYGSFLLGETLSRSTLEQNATDGFGNIFDGYGYNHLGRIDIILIGTGGTYDIEASEANIGQPIQETLGVVDYLECVQTMITLQWPFLSDDGITPNTSLSISLA